MEQIKKVPPGQGETVFLSLSAKYFYNGKIKKILSLMESGKIIQVQDMRIREVTWKMFSGGL